MNTDLNLFTVVAVDARIERQSRGYMNRYAATVPHRQLTDLGSRITIARYTRRPVILLEVVTQTETRSQEDEYQPYIALVNAIGGCLLLTWGAGLVGGILSVLLTGLVLVVGLVWNVILWLYHLVV